MVHDIESAMGSDIDQIDWMSPATKVKAKEKLAAVANKIGYPDKWRDYSKLTVSPTDALGNELRANAFENDRELNKIGKPVDKREWQMTPPTVNAYYDASMNDINFPAGILQPPFYDRTPGLAVNYGHIGAVIGHELTHGFDDEGRKFDAKGNLDDWWTPADAQELHQPTDCLVNEYGSFTAVGEARRVKVNGKLTLGENTADNGGLVLAFMAYLQRAKEDGIDIAAKPTATPARSASTSPSRRTGARTTAPRPSAPRCSRPPLPRPLPRQRRHRQPARLRRRLRLQEAHPHGPRQLLPRLVGQNDAPRIHTDEDGSKHRRIVSAGTPIQCDVSKVRCINEVSS